MVALIKDGVAAPGGIWADLGAGTGNFTRALAELLGADATIYAVDRDARAIAAQRTGIGRSTAQAAIVPKQADFTQPLDLPPLDGVLLANALHFIRDQPATIARIVGYLKPNGSLLVVEYEVERELRWVPFPLPFARLQSLAPAAGLIEPTQIGRRRSPSSGMLMYAAVAMRG